MWIIPELCISPPLSRALFWFYSSHLPKFMKRVHTFLRGNISHVLLRYFKIFCTTYYVWKKLQYNLQLMWKQKEDAPHLKPHLIRSDKTIPIIEEALFHIYLTQTEVTRTLHFSSGIKYLPVSISNLFLTINKKKMWGKTAEEKAHSEVKWQKKKKSPSLLCHFILSHKLFKPQQQ